MRRLALATLLAAGSAFVAACGGGGGDQASAPQQATSTAAGADSTTETLSRASRRGSDPRKNGFEVALGDWALTTEAESIRPGRTVFVVTNRGTMPHGFEIEREDRDDEDKVERRVSSNRGRPSRSS